MYSTARRRVSAINHKYFTTSLTHNKDPRHNKMAAAHTRAEATHKKKLITSLNTLAIHVLTIITTNYDSPSCPSHKEAMCGGVLQD